MTTSTRWIINNNFQNWNSCYKINTGLIYHSSMDCALVFCCRIFLFLRCKASDVYWPYLSSTALFDDVLFCFNDENGMLHSFQILFKNFWRAWVFLWGHWCLLDFWWHLPWVLKPGWIPRLRASLPVCNGFLRFTSGATPAYLSAANMAAEPFWTYNLTDSSGESTK